MLKKLLFVRLSSKESENGVFDFPEVQKILNEKNWEIHKVEMISSGTTIYASIIFIER